MARQPTDERLDFPDAPTGAPAPPASNPIGRGPAPAGGGPAPLTGSGAKLEQMFDTQRSGGGTPGTTSDKFRDPAYSTAQWGAWEEKERKLWEQGKGAGQREGGCPPDKPFTSRPGPNGETACTEKPDDCPPGSTMHGSGCVSHDALPAWAGGGGGAGGGAGAGLSGPGPSGGGDASGLSSLMEANLKGMLAGGTRYTPEAMQGLLAAIKQRIERSKEHQLRQSQGDAASRGMARSGASLSRADDIRRGAEASFTGEYANVLRAKIDADRQDKLDALDRSQKYLDSMRDELYRRDMSAIQRQQFKANLDLAYANIAAQRNNMMAGFQQQRDMLAAQYGYGAVFGG